MGHRSKKRQRRDSANTHFENLIDLRSANPQAYARLGDGPHSAVERYESEKLASTFEFRPGTECLLDLKERLPKVFASFSEATKRMVEEYAEKKRAYQIVKESGN